MKRQKKSVKENVLRMQKKRRCQDEAKKKQEEKEKTEIEKAKAAVMAALAARLKHE